MNRERKLDTGLPLIYPRHRLASELRLPTAADTNEKKDSAIVEPDVWTIEELPPSAPVQPLFRRSSVKPADIEVLGSGVPLSSFLKCMQSFNMLFHVVNRMDWNTNRS